jgi:hypothetical protein
MLGYRRRFAALVILCVLALCGIWAFRAAHQGVAANPTSDKVRIDQAVNDELKGDASFRARYEVHGQFMRLFEKMPTFDHADFGRRARTVYWRSSPWDITWVFERSDGAQYAALAYAQGPGTDQDKVVQLLSGRYIPVRQFNMGRLARDPRTSSGYIPGNLLPRICLDVRQSSGSFAARPIGVAGETLTKHELDQATAGVAELSGTVLSCYRFAGINIVEFVHLADGVLFRAEGGTLTPLSRGYIDFADKDGHFLIVNANAGYTKQELPQEDYLEVFALR